MQEARHVNDLCTAIAALRVDRSSGQPARHQPITLLWAIGRAAAQEPRTVPWSVAQGELRALLEKHGRPGSDPAPEYPFVALSRSELWELNGHEGPVPPARGSVVRRWLDDQNPTGGLGRGFYELMASSPTARDRVVSALVTRFFDAERPSDLLEDTRLDAVAYFDGFGHVPGTTVGQVFVSRRAAFDAGVHRQLQAGISGTQEKGAESIVVSGGYEDDEDHGDVIVYTGQGGRLKDERIQTFDQPLTLGNAALVTSRTTNVPVRVIRGEPNGSGRSGSMIYRYDGLFRVVDYWHATGKSGFLVWRYRLEQLAADESPSREARLKEPVGQDAPTRLETIVQRIVRSTKVANHVKRAHKFTCQVCGIRLATRTGAYAEAAHVRALGRPHNGPDVAANVLCLCPNHHALFDFGMLTIADDLTITDHATGAEIGKLREAPSHRIDRAHLAYHRDHHSEGWKHDSAD
ncbi:YDG/SRA domain-containing protein [Kitasatospora sp. NPDC001309]|uniref:YDG/SRA domain-containing protein n=1 Tax=Kitasatospora sp. NPDC001309 TaxID=3364013 RepID=UPI00368F220E